MNSAVFSGDSKISNIMMMAAVIIGLYLSSLYNYLLFHCLAEFFSIIICCALFMIAWNTREHTENHYLVYLGISYLFVGVIDLFHTLGYKGMKIFTDYDFYANQLWIGARYMESLTLLLFCLFVGQKKRISYPALFIIYTIFTTLILASVFYWKIFPICFVEGKGQTAFKINSEYIICLILFASLIALHKNHKQFDENIYKLLLWSVIFTIGSELAFTFYIDNYGFSNLIGHSFKIISFYLVYKSVIETGLRHPFQLMFKQIKDSEERYKNLFNTSIAGIFRTAPDGSRVIDANSAAAKIFGYESPEEFIAGFVPGKGHISPEYRDEFQQKLEKDHRVEGFEFVIKNQNGHLRHLTLSAVLYHDYIEEAILDITEQIEARQKIMEIAEQEALQRGKLEMASSVLHDVGNAVTGVGTTVARLLGETDWTETAMLIKLENMADQKQEAFETALGAGKGKAMISFLRELRKSSEDHKNRLLEDYRRMAKIISHINDILHLQRRYAGDGKAGQRALSDISELIADASDMNISSFDKRKILISRNIATDLPKISGDRTKMLRVFLNLFKNTCEAFDQSDMKFGRKLDISAELVQDNIRIIIADNAVGFEPEQAESLLKPGFSTKDRDSGMGLPQCREIIVAHGGMIRLESKGKGLGAKVVIDLPIAEMSTDKQG